MQKRNIFQNGRQRPPEIWAAPAGSTSGSAGILPAFAGSAGRRRQCRQMPEAGNFEIDTQIPRCRLVGSCMIGSYFDHSHIIDFLKSSFFSNPPTKNGGVARLQRSRRVARHESA